MKERRVDGEPETFRAYASDESEESLFHGPWCGVSGFRDHRILYRFPLLRDFHRVAGLRIHQFYLDLAELPILGLVRRLVGQGVLIAQRRRNALEDAGELAEEAWEVCLP